MRYSNFYNGTSLSLVTMALGLKNTRTIRIGEEFTRGAYISWIDDETRIFLYEILLIVARRRTYFYPYLKAI